MRNRTLHLHMRAGKVFPNYLRPIAVALLLLCSLLSQAQAPQQFSFQGVARDAAGKIVANSNVGIRLTIHEGAANGSVVLTEEHTPTTSSAGIFNVVVGSAGGNLTNVNWKSNLYFLQVEMDPAGGNVYSDVGSVQMLSVPYALHAEEANRLKNDDPVILTGAINSGKVLPMVGSGARLIWYPREGAFRAGSHTGQWEQPIIGRRSFATGENTEASGANSVAMGEETKATGPSSFAFGIQSTSVGNRSISIGNNLISKSPNGIAFGLYNDVSDDPLGISQPTDRIFQIGNGIGINARSNALTILKNGMVGIGNNVLEPQFLLDLGGRARIRNNGETAGIYFNNSQQATTGFVGMKTDNEVGLYINEWRFWVTGQGNGYLTGTLSQNSDRRLKTNIQPFKNSLGKVNSLQGYHYNWEDKTKDQTLQTGLIAQEVEQVFPELVSTNKDGYKSVNYIGLVPHLIESVKELKSKTDEIAVLRKELEGMREMGKRLELLEASINSGASSRTTKSAAK